MSNSSKFDLIKNIKSDYNKKLKELESKLALKNKELNQIERAINHDTKIINHSHISKLKSKKAEINTTIMFFKKEIKKVKKEKIRKLRKL
ncbi:MAG: hypothetical protein ACTSPN_00085 [Promethearchaeota archaeon]